MENLHHWKKRIRALEGKVNSLASTINELIIISAASGLTYTLTSVKAVPALFNGQFLYLRSLNTEGDGQGGVFWYDETSTATPDDVDVILPGFITLPTAGRILRLNNPS